MMIQEERGQKTPKPPCKMIIQEERGQKTPFKNVIVGIWYLGPLHQPW